MLRTSRSVDSMGRMIPYWSTEDMPGFSYKPMAGTPVNTGLGISSGLVLSAPLNEGDGDEVSDYSPSPLVGYMTDDSIWATDTKYGDILSFPGSESVSFAHNLKINVETYTLAFAVKTTDNVTYRYLLGKGNTPRPYAAFMNFPSIGNISFDAYNGSQNPNPVASAEGYNNGIWHTVIITRSEGAAMQIYVDGILRGQDTDNTSSTTLNTSALQIASSGAGMSGYIGEFAYLHMWNRVLPGVPGNVGDPATGEIAAITADEFAMYR